MSKTKLVPLNAKPRRVSGKGGRARSIAIPAMFFRLSGVDAEADLLVDLYLDGKKLVAVLSIQSGPDVV